MQYESSSVCITYFGDTCKTCLAFVGFQYVSGLEIFWVLLVYYQVPCMNGADWSILLCCCPLVLEEEWWVVEPVRRKGKHVAARLYCLLQRFLGPLCPLTRLGLSAHQCPQFQKLFAFLQLEKRKCAKKKLEKRKVKPM